MRAVFPPNEAERLATLYTLNILDTAPEAAFDALVQLASHICQTPCAVLTLVDKDRQWFKTKIGFDHHQTHRDISFCAHSILEPNELTYVPDASKDPRFADNPDVTKPDGIRLYAGAPLTLSNGAVLGTLCVVDSKVRELTAEQRQGLSLLGMQAVQLLEARQKAELYYQQQRTLTTVINHAPVLLGQIDTHFRYVFCNHKYAEWFGIEPDFAVGKTILQVFGEAPFAEAKPSLEKCLAGETVSFQAKPANGQIFDVNFVPQKNHKGLVESIIIIAANVTEVHQQQLQIKQEHDRMDAIINGSNLGTWEWNVQTGTTIFNERWFTLIGLTSKQQTSVDLWAELSHPEDLIRCTEQLEQHFAKLTPYYDCTFRMKHKAGHWVWIHAIGKVMSWTAEGEPLLMFGVHSDVTTALEKETEILETRSWLQAIIDSSTEVALISTDPLGTIRLFNTGAERMLGYGADELVGKHSPALFHDPAEITAHAQVLSKKYGQNIQGFDVFVHHARQGQSETRQWSYVCKNGDRKQVRLSVSAMRDEHNAIRGFLGVAIDITQLEHLNHALLMSEQRYRSMLDNLPGVVYRCRNDEHWTMLFVSDEVFALTGYKAQQLIRSKEISFAELNYPDDAEHTNSAVQQALANQQRFNVEYRLRHKDGSLRWVQELGQGVYDDNGELLYIDGFIWDVTQQHEALQALSASEQKLSSLYKMAPLAIVLNRFTDGAFIEANPEFYRMLGYKDQPDCSDAPSSAGYATMAADQMTQLQHNGRYGPLEQEIQHQDGHFVPVSVTGVLIQNHEGEQQIWSILQDITERRRIEQMKNQFVSMVSHELRTPLTSISGSLALVTGGVLGPVPGPMVSMLDIAKDNSSRLSQLINDLLDIDKLVAGKMHFDLSLCLISDLLEKSVQSNQPYADKYGVQLQLTEQQDAMVMVDAMRFQQIMANLLSNAAKFSPAGSVVKVRSLLVGDEVRVEVEDEGPGIPDEFKDHMFEKFSQADGADSRQSEGTGLGLSIVKELIEHMDGKVGFYNLTPTGSCFYLNFAQAKQASLNQPKILVVEDDPHVAGFIMQLLQTQGYQSHCATTLKEAVTALDQDLYQAITLDLNLPDGHGSALFAELRSRSHYQSTPVLIISSESKDNHTQLLGGVHALDWLDKPVSPSSLLEKLELLLGADKHQNTRILHVEDDPHLGQILALHLADFASSVQATSVKSAMQLLNSQRFDLVILDIGLPDGSGLELLPELALRQPQTPVVIWSAQELNQAQRHQVDLVLAKSRIDLPALLQQLKNLLAPAP
ncbi:PAS domain S-box protein [Rheinheimera sp. MM224]|uniref:PAS domain S-box protein n=1 Tax=Rheinheimera sp. MM224 TaxID=3019969 RepID=UPI0021F8B268|nr:PAS domain S-box protein [Rheinheimera sp. MM224]CAI3794048.1 Sensor histidine kinase RcsC [Rheinheimera sp. MM224]